MSSSGMNVAVQGALAQSARLEVIANNLANASTVGFRKDTVGLRSRTDSRLPQVDRIQFDRRPGGTEETRRPLDLAIQGAGFFAVRDLRSGADYFTRAGNFETDSSGRLVTADGRCQVLSAEGSPLALDPLAPGSVRVDPDGTIHQGDVENGQLGVVEFEDVARLAKRGDNLYENRGSALGGSPGSRIEQGVLERSSVNPALEMAEMVRALRALEANLQMLRIQDATLERTVNDMARPLR